MDGRPGIIVLNGWAASQDAWSLCRFMREPAPDGRLPRLHSYVDQLDGIPERSFAEGGRFILVGWSMGGSSALRLFCRYPGQVAGMALVAATPRMMEDAAAGWRGMSPRRLEVLRRGLEMTHGQGFFGIPEGKPNPYMTDTPENLERGLRYLRETDLRSELEGMPAAVRSLPVRIFQSASDGIVRSANAEYLMRLFPNAECTIIDGGEHALPISVPDLIDDAVASMLT